jgi:hypothetical protein
LKEGCVEVGQFVPDRSGWSLDEELMNESHLDDKPLHNQGIAAKHAYQAHDLRP